MKIALAAASDLPMRRVTTAEAARNDDGWIWDL